MYLVLLRDQFLKLMADNFIHEKIMKKNNSRDLFSLKGRTALITGAAGLLGYQHAAALLDKGCKVVLTDIDTKKLDLINLQLKKEFLNSQIIPFFQDVSDIDSVISTSNYLDKEGINIDILINNAAINPKLESEEIKESSRLENFANSQWNIEISVGLTGAFNCSKIYGTKMYQRKKSGVIINIASDLSVIAPNQNLYRKDNLKEDSFQPVKPVTYSVIKHGLIGLTKYLATYWTDSNIRCNALSPGGVFNNQDEIFINKISELIPMGRMAFKDEYRSAIQFLSSDASSYMNGHNLIIDGGRTAW